MRISRRTLTIVNGKFGSKIHLAIVGDNDDDTADIKLHSEDCEVCESKEDAHTPSSETSTHAHISKTVSEDCSSQSPQIDD